jgi:hypothetical protein
MPVAYLFRCLRVLTGIVLGGSAALAWASSPEPTGPALLRVGAGEFRYFGFRIYKAELAAPHLLQSERWHEQALALTLTYHRALKGAAIAERSLEEMRRARTIDEVSAQRWLTAMSQCFPDVQEGDRLRGSYRPDAGIWFSHNGQARCHITDARFARQFMGIWLGDTTSAPELRAQLLGLQPSTP